MAFWRPGAPKPEAPLSLEVDRQGGGDFATLVAFNPNDALGLAQQRQRLPAYKVREPLLYLLECHATVIVVGATGSGKTTQIPQYLAEAGWADGGRCIACTQPRRVAAQTVAVRVAEEMGCRLGAEVGYSIRFEDVSTKGVTRIKYVTDGTLIRELMDDPLLSRYSVVMVDEAHERSLATDLLLGLLKKVQRRRPALRLLVASATLEAEALAAYFDTRAVRAGPPVPRNPSLEAPCQQPAVLSIEGRMFPVAVSYLERPCADYVLAAAEAVLALHAAGEPGDVLVFLPGQAEIERCVSLLRDAAAAQRGGGTLAVFPLYAGLAPAQQLAAFGPVARGSRKAVVATSVAETSVTLEGVTYVVDSCFAKATYYDARAGVQALVTLPASRAACVQRAGRAGRVRPGRAMRLCTEAAFTALPPAPVPEVQRADLAGVVLQLKALGVDDILAFEWLAPPPADAMLRALELLYALGALDAACGLTQPLGGLLAELPLPPMLGRALLCAGELRCVEPMLTVAACLQVQSLWLPRGAAGGTAAFDEKRARFAVAEGDHVTALNAYSAYAKAAPHARPAWCARNALSARALARVADVRRQLAAHLRAAGVVDAPPPPGGAETASRDAAPVRRALTAGFFAHAAKRVDSGDGMEGARYVSVRSGTALRIHPSSVLHRCAPAAVIYDTAVHTEALYMHDVAAIQLDWLPELAPHFYEKGKAEGRR